VDLSFYFPEMLPSKEAGTRRGKSGHATHTTVRNSSWPSYFSIR